MGLDVTTADYALNAIRRQIQEEFPELTLFFITYQDGERRKAFEAKRRELYDHADGETLASLLHTAVGDNSMEFCGISVKKERKFFNFLTTEKILACFFVDAGNLQSPEDARRHALFLVWHALALIDDFKNKRKEFYSISNGVILPTQNETLPAWRNMLADAFSVLMLEMEKRRDSIGKLARTRSLAAITPSAYNPPEDFPFPMVLDATRLVYNDLSRMKSHESPMKKALQMTQEIGETFSPDSVKHWWAFTKRAQDMAWLGAKENIILAAAAYNTDDAEARATAYLIADILNIQTLNPIAHYVYSPFADEDMMERHHVKSCEESFQLALSKSHPDEEDSVFANMAKRQNQNLKDGNLVGWCAHPLLRAAFVYSNSKEPDKEAKIAFDTAMAQLPWAKIQQFANLVITLRKSGTAITPATLAEEVKKHEGLEFLEQALLFGT